MKNILILILFNLAVTSLLLAQDTITNSKKNKDIHSLIEKYSQAREKRDTILLKNILTTDIDQLVSTGEWRNGIDSSVKGMLNSSAASPGTRTLKVEKIRFLDSKSAIVDARYEIQSTKGTARKMWSTFIVVYKKDTWKIGAIRNMMPTEK